MSDERDETWRGLRPSLVVGMRRNGDYEREGSSNGGHSAAREDNEMFDTGGLPSIARGVLLLLIKFDVRKRKKR